VVSTVRLVPPRPATLPPDAFFIADGKGKRKEVAIDDAEGGKKRKRSSKPKDPNAPKRPASSYILFQNEIRAQLRQEFPHLSNPELLAVISDKWKNMSEAEKEVSRTRLVLVPCITKLGFPSNTTRRCGSSRSNTRRRRRRTMRVPQRRSRPQTRQQLRLQRYVSSPRRDRQRALTTSPPSDQKGKSLKEAQSGSRR